MRAREGDFVETFDGLIFDVKGLFHPPGRIVAYLRYLPDGRGSRKRGGVRYRKVYSLYARDKLLARKWPQYIHLDPHLNRKVQAVPISRVKEHYIPSKKLAELRREVKLDQWERLAAKMAETLMNESGISASKIGVSGSILVGLQTPNSDIDLIVYGIDAARACRSKLESLLNSHSLGFEPYVRRDLRKLYAQRGLDSATSFETFVRHERTKVLEGKFRGTDYFIRCVKEWDELEENYGDKEYYPIGRVTLHATIDDDSESIFTPCTYHLSDANVTGKRLAPTEIVSFRGRFCEQARAGDNILARGVLERIKDEHGVTHRVIIGENPLDCLVVVGKRSSLTKSPKRML